MIEAGPAEIQSPVCPSQNLCKTMEVHLKEELSGGYQDCADDLRCDRGI